MWVNLAQKDKKRYEREMREYTAIARERGDETMLSPPKRPMSAYLSYSNKRRSALKDKNPGASAGDISRMLSTEWKNLDPTIKEQYRSKERELRAQYKRDIQPWRRKRKSCKGVKEGTIAAKMTKANFGADASHQSSHKQATASGTAGTLQPSTYVSPYASGENHEEHLQGRLLSLQRANMQNTAAALCYPSEEGQPGRLNMFISGEDSKLPATSNPMTTTLEEATRDPITSTLADLRRRIAERTPLQSSAGSGALTAASVDSSLLASLAQRLPISGDRRLLDQNNHTDLMFLRDQRLKLIQHAQQEARLCSTTASSMALTTAESQRNHIRRQLLLQQMQREKDLQQDEMMRAMLNQQQRDTSSALLAQQERLDPSRGTSSLLATAADASSTATGVYFERLLLEQQLQQQLQQQRAALLQNAQERQSHSEKN